jgi:hypothetical protein
VDVIGTISNLEILVLGGVLFGAVVAVRFAVERFDREHSPVIPKNRKL